MSRQKKKPTQALEVLRALCIMSISEQTTAKDLSAELLRQHEIMKEYISTLNNGGKK